LEKDGSLSSFLKNLVSENLKPENLFGLKMRPSQFYGVVSPAVSRDQSRRHQENHSVQFDNPAFAAGWRSIKYEDEEIAGLHPSKIVGLEIGRAFQVGVILLDEPFEDLPPIMVGRLKELVLSLKEAETAISLSEPRIQEHGKDSQKYLAV
jgi:hypothetical protein